MTPEEKKIEEAAKATYPNMYENSAFITGAKSDAAKEYHTKGLLSKEEILSFFNEYMPKLLLDCIKEDFENYLKRNKKEIA